MVIYGAWSFRERFGARHVAKCVAASRECVWKVVGKATRVCTRGGWWSVLDGIQGWI